MPVCPDCEQGMTPASIQWEDGSMTHGAWLCGCRQESDGAILVRHTAPIRYVWRFDPEECPREGLRQLLQGATVYVVPRRVATQEQLDTVTRALHQAIGLCKRTITHPVPDNWRDGCAEAIRVMQHALERLQGRGARKEDGGHGPEESD